MCEPPSARTHRPEASARFCRVLSIIDKPPASLGVSPSVNLARTLRAPKIPFAEFAPSIPDSEVWPFCTPLRCSTTAAGEHTARQTQRGPQRAAPPFVCPASQSTPQRAFAAAGLVKSPREGAFPTRANRPNRAFRLKRAPRMPHSQKKSVLRQPQRTLFRARDCPLAHRFDQTTKNERATS